MSLALDRFPADILSAISSYWSFEELRTVLSLCPGSPLAQRFKNGGVTYVAVPASSGPKGLTLVTSINSLLHVSLSLAQLPMAEALRRIRCLPSTLLHLELSHFKTGTLLVSEEIETDSAFGDSTFRGFACWSVSKAFPRLRTLTITRNTNNIDSLSYTDFHPPEFNTRFITLLPASLTILHIENMELWRFTKPLLTILPPCLTRLAGKHFLFPTPYSLSEALKDSLLDLDLNLALERHTPLSHFLGTYPLEARDAQSSSPPFDHLTLPPNLTRLSITPCEFLSLEDPFLLPTSLLSLTLSKLHLKDLARTITILPHTLTGFYVELAPLSKDRAPLHLDLVPPKPSMKVLNFIASFEVLRHEEDSDILALLLSAFPSLSSCTLRTSGRRRGLQEEHLESFNPSTLQVLNATISGDLAAKLQRRCPKLLTLACYSPNGPYDPSFDSSSVAPSLTSLTLLGFELPLRALELLPLSVTELKSDVSMSANDVDFLRRHSIPQAQLKEFKASEVDLSAREYTRLDLSHSCGFERFKQQNGESRLLVSTSHLPLYASRLSDLPLSYADLPLAPTLTDIRFTQEDIKIDDASFNAQSLPHLRKLYFHARLPQNLQLGAFSRLESLHVGSIATQCKSSCPPNLTSLKARFDLLLPDCFLPLPTSIQKIRSGLSIAPLERVFPKDGCKIRSFVSHGLANLSRITFILDSLPSTLTRLGFTLNNEMAVPDWMKTLRQRFPLLSEIVLPDDSYLRITLLHTLCSTGAQVLGGIMLAPEVDYLLKLGGIEFSTDGNLLKALQRSAVRAFPNARNATKNMEYGMHFDMDTSVWRTIALALPSHLTELDLYVALHLPVNFLTLLPPSLVKLSVPALDHSAGLQLGFSALSSLQDLTIGIRDHSWNAFTDFPRSLTRLELPQFHSELDRNHILGLPPRLTNLICAGRSIHLDALPCLPPSLLRLECPPLNIAPSDLHMLPHSLKVCVANIPMLDVVRPMALERGLILLQPEPHWL